MALAQGVALELDTLGVVHDTIENGVGEGGFSDDVMQAAHRQLAGEERRGAAVTILDDLEQVRRCSAVIGSGPQSSRINKRVRQRLRNRRG